MTGKCHGHNKSDKPFRPGKKQPFWMPDTEDVIAELGNEPPLIADGRSGPPDRREVSARWLSGTFLTGVTSSVLMGVALFAALDGRQQLATPPEIAELIILPAMAIPAKSAKTTRLVGAAPDRQGQGPPADGSVDGDQGRRPRRHPHHAFRADQDGAGRRPHHQPRSYPPSIPMAGVSATTATPCQPATASAASARSTAPRSKAR